MISRTTELNLADSYEFEVIVNFKNNTFAGELTLSPNGVRLEIMGNESLNENFSRDFFYLDEDTVIHARDGNDNFLLYKFKPIRALSKTLSRLDNKGFFKVVFNVAYVIFSPYHLKQNQQFLGFSIRSEQINNLFGTTKISQELLNNQDSGYEFGIETENYTLGYVYDYYYLYDQSKRVQELKPSINVNFFENANNLQNSLIFLKQIRNVFSFLYGSDIQIDQITYFSQGSFGDLDAFLYYPTATKSQNNAANPILTRYVGNQAFANGGKDGFTIDHLANFLSLNEKECSYFEKYLRYKNMTNIEEKFLGFFRILESCVYLRKSYVSDELLIEYLAKVKQLIETDFNDNLKPLNSLTARLKTLNYQKYNTQTCILKFYKSIIPLQTQHWIYAPSDIEHLCKLRNDITHANEYELDNIDKKTKFIEVLTVFCLLELLEVEKSTILSTLQNLAGYRSIVKYDRD